MGIKQNANNSCNLSLLDIRWTYEGKGKVRKHSKAFKRVFLRVKRRQGNEPELGRTTKMASSPTYIPTAPEALIHLSLHKQQLAAYYVSALTPWNSHSRGEDRRLLRESL